jgi:hypothetical protein
MENYNQNREESICLNGVLCDHPWCPEHNPGDSAKEAILSEDDQWLVPDGIL